jgi:hypothetical protein
MSEVQVNGRIRQLLEVLDDLAVGNDDLTMGMGPHRELLVALGASSYQESVRNGRAFWVNTTTAVASVVALPTTATALAIYNNEPDGGRSYIIDWVAAQNIVSGAATGNSTIIANLGQTRAAVPTDAGLAIKKANGLGLGKDTRAMTITAGTVDAVTGVAANWFPLGSSVGKPGAVAVGVSIWVPVDGRLIVPPGRWFATHTFSDIVTDTFQMYIAWHEKQLRLG